MCRISILNSLVYNRVLNKRRPTHQYCKASWWRAQGGGRRGGGLFKKLLVNCFVLRCGQAPGLSYTLPYIWRAVRSSAPLAIGRIWKSRKLVYTTKCINKFFLCLCLSAAATAAAAVVVVLVSVFFFSAAAFLLCFACVCRQFRNLF